MNASFQQNIVSYFSIKNKGEAGDIVPIRRRTDTNACCLTFKSITEYNECPVRNNANLFDKGAAESKKSS